MTTDGSEELPIVVNIVNFQYTGGFRFDSTKIQRYTGPFPDDYILKPGDVLVVMTCQTPKGEILGVPGRIPKDGRAYLHNQRLGLACVKDPGALDIGYLYYLFLSSRFNAHLFGSATGAKILHTAPSRIEDYRFDCPPISVQRKVAAFLSAYDDLIENNTRRIKILEQMAQAIYREWFVRFRFPGHKKVKLAPSPLGPIPAAWRVEPMAEAVSLSRKGINPGDHSQEIFEHFSIPAFDQGRLPTLDHGENIKSNKFLVRESSVLLSKLNPRIPRVWLPLPCGIYRAIASTEFLVLTPRRPLTREFL